MIKTRTTARVYILNHDGTPSEWYFGARGLETGIFHDGDESGPPRLYADVDDNGVLIVTAMKTDGKGENPQPNGFIMATHGGQTEVV